MLFSTVSPFWVIIIGAAGFSATLLYDLLQLRSRSHALTAASVVGSVAVVTATVATLFVAPLPAASWWLLIAATAAFVLFAWQLWRSVVVEIPHATIREGTKRRVIDSGSYASVRHPGFVWYLCIHVVIVAVFRNRVVTLVSATLVLMDLVVVLIEDQLIFPRLFADYRDYRKRVPLIVPKLHWRTGEPDERDDVS